VVWQIAATVFRVEHKMTVELKYCRFAHAGYILFPDNELQNGFLVFEIPFKKSLVSIRDSWPKNKLGL